MEVNISCWINHIFKTAHLLGVGTAAEPPVMASALTAANGEYRYSIVGSMHVSYSSNIIMMATLPGQNLQRWVSGSVRYLSHDLSNPHTQGRQRWPSLCPAGRLSWLSSRGYCRWHYPNLEMVWESSCWPWPYHQPADEVVNIQYSRC